MKYILNFESKTEYDNHIADNFVRPYVALINDTDEVIFMDENEIFPMYIETQQDGYEDYILSATAQSAAFADYFLRNAVFDGLASYDLSIPSGCLFIDGAEVTAMTAEGYANIAPNYIHNWWSRSDKYSGGHWEFYFYLNDKHGHSKGDILIHNDN